MQMNTGRAGSVFLTGKDVYDGGHMAGSFAKARQYPPSEYTAAACGNYKADTDCPDDKFEHIRCATYRR